MTRIGIRAKYVSVEPTLSGRSGWAHRGAHAPGETWGFGANSGARG